LLQMTAAERRPVVKRRNTPPCRLNHTCLSRPFLTGRLLLCCCLPAVLIFSCPCARDETSAFSSLGRVVASVASIK